MQSLAWHSDRSTVATGARPIVLALPCVVRKHALVVGTEPTSLWSQATGCVVVRMPNALRERLSRSDSPPAFPALLNSVGPTWARKSMLE